MEAALKKGKRGFAKTQAKSGMNQVTTPAPPKQVTPPKPGGETSIQ
jgi:hypothetical protein